MKVPLLVNKLEKAVPKEKFPLQLAVGQVVEVNDHPNADSLYLLKVDMGKLGKRQVVAGLKKYLSKEDLRGRKYRICCQHETYQIARRTEEAMILAADDGIHVGILEADKTSAGEEVHFEGTENARAEITFEDFFENNHGSSLRQSMVERKKLAGILEGVKVHGINDGAKVR